MKRSPPLRVQAEAHAAAGDYAAAEGCYLEAVARGGHDAKLYRALGAVQERQGKLGEAAAQYRRALHLEPGAFEALAALGAILRQLGESEEAAQLWRRALMLRPDSHEANCNLGVVLNELERLREAERVLRRAIALRPDFASAHYQLGNSLAGLGLYDEAVLAYRRAIALEPGLAAARWNLAQVLLLLEQWAVGWEELEHRWQVEPLCQMRRRFTQPLWQGEDVSGKTVLLHAEPGYGDTIQFVRYAPLLAARGARVLLQVQPALARLCRSVEGVAEVYTTGAALPAFDLHCPLLSLPRAFRTVLQTIPVNVPYLQVAVEDRKRWTAKLGPTVRFRVGLVWSSGVPGDDPNRFLAGTSKSIPLATLAPLAQTRGVEFHALQKGVEEREAANSPLGAHIHRWGHELRDFGDTAALIEQLDVVITVDTAVAHLAGALGKPVWVLLKFQHCWRWLQNRDDSPWYAGARLFRQPETGDWHSVVKKVQAALRAEVSGVKRGSWDHLLPRRLG